MGAKALQEAVSPKLGNVGASRLKRKPRSGAAAGDVGGRLLAGWAYVGGGDDCLSCSRSGQLVIKLSASVCLPFCLERASPQNAKCLMPLASKNWGRVFSFRATDKPFPSPPQPHESASKLASF